MKMEIKNIGLIECAKIELEGITVLAGENNTGKSTISKSLYSAFNSLSHLGDRVLTERKNNLKRIILDFFSAENRSYRIILSRKNLKNQLDDLMDDIILAKDLKIQVEHTITLLYEEIKKKNPEIIINPEVDINDSSDRIAELIGEIENSLSIKSDQIQLKLTDNIFKKEFNNQISNMNNYLESSLTLTIKDRDTKYVIENNKVVQIEGASELEHTCVYIDNPFVLEELPSLSYFQYLDSMYISSNNTETHKNSLIQHLMKENDTDIINQIKVDDKLSEIYKKINTIAPGQLENNKEIGYKHSSSSNIINLGNLSAGLKTFIIIKKLLENGTLKQNGTLILDEPEIHLHPEWQIILAEIIVLIQKNFNMHILLTTHSPYFLYAIEVFTARHKIKDKTNYYLAKRSTTSIEFYNVKGSIDEIYEKLSKPFQQLEDLIYED